MFDLELLMRKMLPSILNKPNIIITLGERAFNVFTDKHGIGVWRGSLLWNEALGCKVIGTHDPMMVMRSWELCPLVLFDFTKARKESIFSELRYREPELITVDSVEEARWLLEQLRTANTMVAFDIETDPEVNALTAIGFCNSADCAFTIPFDNRFTIVEQGQLVELIKTFLESSVPKIAQNAQFDVLWLREMLKIHTTNLVLDTMVAHDVCYTEIPKKLAVLASIYTDVPYYKNLFRESGALYKYNALDCIATFRAATALFKEMDDMGVRKFYYMIPHPLLDPLMDMQERGVRVDLVAREEAKKEVNHLIDLTLMTLNKEVGYDVNVNSSKQMCHLLYDELKLPKQINKQTGSVTANEKALEALSKKVTNPIFELVLEARGHMKVLSTYLEMPLGKDERMHTGYVIGGTTTGRLSSKRSLFYSGGNLQNVPKGVCRRMFIPDEGKVFIDADLSQAEARIVALISGEMNMQQVFKSGGDIHTQNAARIFGVSADSVTPDQRQLAKKMVHALNYGLGYKSFAGHCRVSLSESKQLIEKYFTAFPMIRQWHMRTENELRKNRTLTNLFGRKRIFFGRWGDDLFREAYAYIPQSTIGDLLNLILIRVFNTVKVLGIDAQILLQVHDSIVVQCKPEDVKRVVAVMHEANDFNQDGIVIPLEAKVGPNWDACKEVVNG